MHAAKARNDLIRDIDTRRDLNAQLAGELQAAQQKLQVTLREIASGAAGASADASLPIRPFRGDLDWPVTPAGNRRPAKSGTSPIASGIEIPATEGATVTAVHDGVVAFAGPFGGFGNLVIVEHGPQTFSLYGNLLEMAVNKGDRLERGQPRRHRRAGAGRLVRAALRAAHRRSVGRSTTMAQETAMSSRTRAIVLSVTAPVILFVLVGGVLGRAMGREETYQHLKIFDDVVSLISSNYVEPANLDKVMKGAMNGLVDSLDADSAFLTPELVKQFESTAPPAPAETGLELTRQYYLRVIAARDNSPAAKSRPPAGRLHPRD